MQPTLDRWNKTTSLGDGMKFGNSGTGASYAELMDTVVKSDNGGTVTLTPPQACW